jgi:hypothetical protein
MKFGSLIAANLRERRSLPKGHPQMNSSLGALPALFDGAGFGLQPAPIVWNELRSGALEDVLSEWALPH